MRSLDVPAMAEERRDPSFELTKYHSDLIKRLRPQIDERRGLIAEWQELTTRIKQLKSINLESQDTNDIRDIENRISEIQQRINELSRIIKEVVRLEKNKELDINNLVKKVESLRQEQDKLRNTEKDLSESPNSSDAEKLTSTRHRLNLIKDEINSILSVIKDKVAIKKKEKQIVRDLRTRNQLLKQISEFDESRQQESEKEKLIKQKEFIDRKLKDNDETYLQELEERYQDTDVSLDDSWFEAKEEAKKQVHALKTKTGAYLAHIGGEDMLSTIGDGETIENPRVSVSSVQRIRKFLDENRIGISSLDKADTQDLGISWIAEIIKRYSAFSLVERVNSLRKEQNELIGREKSLNEDLYSGLNQDELRNIKLRLNAIKTEISSTLKEIKATSAEREKEVRETLFSKVIPTLETFPRRALQDLFNRQAEVQKRKPEIATDEKVQLRIESQKGSLNRWIKELLNHNSYYPIWARVWALDGVIKLNGVLKHHPDGTVFFEKRRSTTLEGFIDLNPEALAFSIGYIVDTVGKGLKSEESIKDTNFNNVYSYFLNKIRREKREVLNTVEGKWIRYTSGEESDLVEDIKGKSTGWCIAEENYASDYLSKGDTYIYFSHDREGNPTIPRIGISFGDGEEIIKIGGIDADQTFDPKIIENIDIVLTKLKEFGWVGEKWVRVIDDQVGIDKIMRLIKHNPSYELTKEQIEFLNSNPTDLDNVGTDPRVAQILSFIQIREKYQIISFDFKTIDIVINSGGSTEIFQIIDLFDTKSQNYLVLKLISLRDFELLSQKMRYCKNLSIKVAKALINENQISLLGENLHSFNTLEKEIGIMLIEENFAYEVVKHKRKFPGITLNSEVVKMIIDTQQYNAIAENLNDFDGLDASIGEILIDKGFALEVFDSLKSFTNLVLDTRLLNKVLDVDYEEMEEELRPKMELVLGKFPNNLDTNVAKRLISLGYASAVLGHYEKFQGLEHNTEIANLIIDSGQEKVLIDYLAYFNDLDNSVAYKLIQIGATLKVLQYHKIFTRLVLDANVASKIIEAKETGDSNFRSENGPIYDLASYIGYFSDLDTHTAMALLLEGYYDTVIENLDKFKDLSSFVIVHIFIFSKGSNNHEGASNFAQKLKGFKHVFKDDIEIIIQEIESLSALGDFTANMLIDTGLSEYVTDYMYYFRNLSKNTAIKLHNEGKDSYVRDNPESFNFDVDKLEEYLT